MDGLALDRILHGQNVIGKTSKTVEIDAIRFQDKDLAAIGTLEFGQFGVVYVVTCRLDGRVYVRKSIEKRFALRNRDQCFPQFERDILRQASKTNSVWAPHLLCAFQTTTHLNLVMDYAEGGNLWEVLESSPHNGKVLESDLRWWTPQIVSAIHWCHSQGFVHRDVKPHNFVLTPTAHVLLIDFGSAAPLLPPNFDGVQFLPKRYCLVPCGTCDYISPEILQAHEAALVALEMREDANFLAPSPESDDQGYGRETDWWSLGAMLYEMAYGFAPFFAKDIRKTYLRIIDHEKSLRFDRTADISAEYQNFLSLLLTRAEQRLGRRNIQEITNHSLFDEVNWDILSAQPAPSDLHLPQFTYAEPANVALSDMASTNDDSHSQGFNFSALFQSSVASSSPAISLLQPGSSRPSRGDGPTASFIGFSWGPTLNAFPQSEVKVSLPHHLTNKTPRHFQQLSTTFTPNSKFSTPIDILPQMISVPNRYSTPNRPTSLTPFQTLRRTGTVGRTTVRRNLSDREAMKQLVDCVGMSARKRVLESGRKPRILTSFHSSKLKDLSFALKDSNSSEAGSSSLIQRRNSEPFQRISDERQEAEISASEETSESEGPPSPTPRQSSYMSILSSRRAATPTMTSTRSGTSSSLPGVPRNDGVRSRSNSSSKSLQEGGTESLAILRSPNLEEMERRLQKLVGEVMILEKKVGRVRRMIG